PPVHAILAQVLDRGHSLLFPSALPLRQGQDRWNRRERDTLYDLKRKHECPTDRHRSLNRGFLEAWTSPLKIVPTLFAQARLFFQSIHLSFGANLGGFPPSQGSGGLCFSSILFGVCWSIQM